MGKVNIGGGSPLTLKFFDDKNKPIRSVTFNGSEVKADAKGLFVTDIETVKEPDRPVYRVTKLEDREAILDYKSGQ